MKMRTMCGTILAAVVAVGGVGLARPVPGPQLAARLADGPEIIGIVHWGLNTYTDREWGYGGTMNIGIAPNKDGVLDADDVKALRDFGELRKALFAHEANDGENFNVVDLLVDYREAPEAVADAVRLVVLSTPPGITPGLVEFTVFGTGNVKVWKYESMEI